MLVENGKLKKINVHNQGWYWHFKRGVFPLVVHIKPCPSSYFKISNAWYFVNAYVHTHKWCYAIEDVLFVLNRGPFYDGACAHIIKVKGGTNVDVVNYIECCNFWTINAKYIIVYIFGKEMSQRVHYWHLILLRILIFWENCNNNKTFLTENFSDGLKKTVFR